MRDRDRSVGEMFLKDSISPLAIKCILTGPDYTRFSLPDRPGTAPTTSAAVHLPFRTVGGPGGRHGQCLDVVIPPALPVFQVAVHVNGLDSGSESEDDRRGVHLDRVIMENGVKCEGVVRISRVRKLMMC